LLDRPGEVLVGRVGLDVSPDGLGLGAQVADELRGGGVEIAGRLNQFLFCRGRPDSLEDVDRSFDFVTATEERLVGLAERGGVHLEGTWRLPVRDVGLQAVVVLVPDGVDVGGHLGHEGLGDTERHGVGHHPRDQGPKLGHVRSERRCRRERRVAGDPGRSL
jgi:hypothetical protein